MWLFSDNLMRWAVNEQLKPYQLSLNEQSKLSFNPFIVKLTVEELSLVNKSQLQATDASKKGDIQHGLELNKFVADLNIVAMLSKQLSFDQLVLSGLDINIARLPDDFVVAGISLKELSKNSTAKTVKEQQPTQQDSEPLKGWEIELSNIEVSNIDIQFDDFTIQPNTDLGVRQQLSLANIETNRLVASLKHQLASVIVTGDINSAPFYLSVDGKHENHLGNADVKINITDFEYQQLAAYLPASIASFNSKTSLSLELTTLLEPTKVNIEIKSLGLSNNDLRLEDEKMLTTLNRVDIKGDGLSVDINNINLESSSNQVVKDNQAVSKQENPIVPAIEIIPEASPNVSVKGQFNITLAGLNINSVQDGTNITSLAVLDLPNLNVRFLKDELSITSPRLVLNDLVFFEQANANVEGSVERSTEESKKDQTLTRVEQIKLSGINYQESIINVEHIELSKVVANIILNKQRQLANLPAAFSTEQASATEEAEAAEQESKVNSLEQENSPEHAASPERKEAPILFSIGQFNIIQSSPIYFQDNSFKTPFERQIDITQLNIGNVSNLDKNSETTFDFETNIDQHANLSLKGTVKPWTEQHNIAFKLNLNEFSLPNISSYIGQTAGFEFTSGQLDSVIDISIVNNKLSGSSDLLLRGVNISNDSDEQETANSINVIPLGTAFNMLKDDNVMAATETYLMQTFVPYANIISIAKFAGKEMLKVNVEDLMYQQGQVALMAEQMEFVNELSALLITQYDLQLKLCPVAMEVESLPEQVSNLKQLARLRGEALKSYLVSEKGIESKRILLCTPKVGNEAKQLPRIEFTL